MKDAQKAGLIVNWIGRQCIMTLHLMGVTLDSPRTVFDNLEKIFRPESNQTLSRFKFHGMKQKQGQNCDMYMSDLRLSIVECRYPDLVQDELLKDQFIFGLAIKEIQDHLLGGIKAEDPSEKCLLEARKIELKIEQRKLLGIKTTMTYNSVQHRGRGKFCSKSQGRGQSSSHIKSCKYCGKSHNKGNCPAFGKRYQKCRQDNHFKAVCKSNEGRRDHSKPRQKKGKGKKFHEVNEEDGVMDDLTDQVQSLFCNDVHFNAINKRMHTLIKCETPDGWSSDQTFKIDTEAGGNLMPIIMFTKLFPYVSLDALSRMVDRSVTLYAYNNTAIKQFGTCQIRLNFKGRSFICKFYVVEHEMAIVGISDAEKLRLVWVNFDTARDVKILHEINEGQAFKDKIERTYPQLFKGIGLMDGEISIKLKSGSIPHVEPVRRVPHAMQEPLKMSLTNWFAKRSFTKWIFQSQ